MKEDPTRDPASEARDDHASEPRATPETDARVDHCLPRLLREAIDADFARDLERKLAEARLEAATSADFITILRCELAEARTALESIVTSQSWEAYALRLERQRDELMEALEFYRKHMLLGCDITDSGQVAEAAIAAVKGGTP